MNQTRRVRRFTTLAAFVRDGQKCRLIDVHASPGAIYDVLMGTQRVGSILAAALLSAISTGPIAAAGGAQTPRGSGVLTVDGAPHPYLTEGTGLTCVVVGLASSYPPLFSGRLKQRIRFVYVDFKRSWNAESADRIERITLDSLVEEVDQVRRGLGLDRVCLVGHSAPGLVAVEYSLRYPDRVSRMLLVGVEPYLTPDFVKKRTDFCESDASAERKAALTQVR
jgi:hypothetical protein